ncbi:hypothetical protein [Hydrogenophaga sp.]|uniref:hypothetical protein n=1 Tax=Hydrogenophaga sp. TaxID=1904254 RepID=UPI00271F5EC2|nr:hypothetical protein [Hydrogenophaga sp.]MDO9131997.1 hypothetical protein [Hydrogenophaga sp.]
MKRKQYGFTAVEGITVVWLGLALVALGGWIANIFKLVDMLGGDISAMFIARVVGVFAAPLGAVLGFF